MYSFGSGVLIGTRSDIANATPLNFASFRKSRSTNRPG